MACGAVVVAAGRSQRMGFNKTTMPLAGRQVILRVLDVLSSVQDIVCIVVVIAADNLISLERRLSSERYRIAPRICLGGKTRQESVRNGVDALPDVVDLVLIHDAARPLVTPALISTGIAEAEHYGAAIAALPVTDTIKLVEADRTISRTLDRSRLYAAQTPQVFRRDWLTRAYERIDQQTAFSAFTDESSLLEWAGFEVRIFPGSDENIKLTTPTDLVVAESILARREKETR